VMAWLLAWPAMNPTATSFAVVGDAEPELAAVPVLALPAEPSSGLVGLTPENSWTFSANADAPVLTVTLLTDCAFAAYHISPSEFAPGTANAPIFVHVFFPSLTAVICLLTPVNTPAERTRRFPAVLGDPSVTVVVEEPADCTSAAPGGVVTFAGGVLKLDTFPAPSRASTVYW
jgi:hypothetical protein